MLLKWLQARLRHARAPLARMAELL